MCRSGHLGVPWLRCFDRQIIEGSDTLPTVSLLNYGLSCVSLDEERALAELSQAMVGTLVLKLDLIVAVTPASTVRSPREQL